jgi:hypothetical protein
MAYIRLFIKSLVIQFLLFLLSCSWRGGGSGTSRSSSGHIWLHCWEEQHLLDVVRVGHEHGQAIDTAAPATGWRQTVLQCGNEVLIESLSFIITSCLILYNKNKAKNKKIENK